MPTVHRKASKSHIQTLLFPREFWTRAKSRKWAIEHDFHADGVEVTKKYIRLRQYDPQSRKFDYRFVRMKRQPPIFFVYGYPKGGKRRR